VRRSLPALRMTIRERGVGGGKKKENDLRQLGGGREGHEECIVGCDSARSHQRITRVKKGTKGRSMGKVNSWEGTGRVGVRAGREAGSARVFRPVWYPWRVGGFSGRREVGFFERVTFCKETEGSVKGTFLGLRHVCRPKKGSGTTRGGGWEPP